MTGPPTVAGAADAARRGQLVVFPTDTVYGIGTRPDDAAATARLFEAKGRSRALTLPVLVASIADARRVAILDARSERIAAACWPGALTIVVRRSDVSRGWDLGAHRGTVGVRWPNHPVARALLEATGPLAVTSANRSGRPPARSRDELVAAFGETVGVYLVDDEPLGGAASTVADLTGDVPTFLRRGDVDPDVVARLWDGA